MIQNLHTLSNRIWYLAGDTSTDYNWYTKRALVSTTFLSTELFMLQDESESNSETFAFLDRRINEILSAGVGIMSARNVFSASIGGIGSLFEILK